VRGRGKLVERCGRLEVIDEEGGKKICGCVWILKIVICVRGSGNIERRNKERILGKVCWI
jgi:hypothetical protein